MSAESVFVTSIIVGAGFVRGALGFGDALFAMPLLALLLPTRTAAPLVALTATLIATVILIRDWRDVVWRPATILTVSGLLAVPFGVWLLKSGDDRLVKLLLACVVLVFSFWSLRHTERLRLHDDRLAPVFGVVAGLLGGAYNTAGPPLVIFGTLRSWSPRQFRATLQTYCLISSLWVIVMHGWNDLMTSEIVRHFGFSAPLIIAATLLGRRVTSRISTERFVRFVYAALIIVGVWLLYSCTLKTDSPTSDGGPDPFTSETMRHESRDVDPPGSGAGVGGVWRYVRV